MSPPAPRAEESIRTELDDSAQLDDTVRCLRCRSEITTPTLSVEQAGAHEHTFRNPAGYSWRIACFRDAAGCTTAGGFTGEASWFSGYEWCFAPCAACGRHLGWWFVGAGPSFVALIVSRITR